ncbi:DMT family transporter [Alicyclobacillus sp. SO9]|uniref:EamA family transporter n=1 Tax=Alicyclobacillus sp. SO9 TaxID=2665646 RepID=UPI0018E76130|nr:DMT family transporter [Alicyclobacillus sp. SO9]QQE77787.1 EamA family transporter [Alicyclobacillus sp. SO9]
MSNFNLEAPLDTAYKTAQTSRIRGFIMVLVGAALWGISGTVAQRLFQFDSFHPAWLVAVRMSVSGLVLLTIAGLRRHHPFAVWRTPGYRSRLLIFSFAGLLAVQYTFFAAVATGNAATATFLQYLGPVFITVYFAIRLRKLPGKSELFAVLFAVIGTLLLVTNGHLSTLIVPVKAVIWGLLSALALAFYTVYPGNLIRRFDSASMIGWGMLLGGLGLYSVAPPWAVAGQQWSWLSALFVAIVVIFGTLIPFYLYLASLRHISPSETSLLGGLEPLAATVTSVLWLHIPFGVATAAGGLCILATVTLLSVLPRNKTVQ